MSGVIYSLPLYVFVTWCLVQYRGNFTFYFCLYFRYTLLRKSRIQWHGHKLHTDNNRIPL